MTHLQLFLRFLRFGLLAFGGPVAQIAMIRRETGAQVPLCWTDAYVDPHYAAVRRLAAKFPEHLLCDLLETHCGRPIATVEQTVTACAIPPKIATHVSTTL